MDDPATQSTWCEISLPRISANLAQTLARLPDGTGLCAVLKGNAYGHGIENVVPLLMAQRVNTIGICSNPEARAVRRAGFGGTILRLRAATPSEIYGARGAAVEEMTGTLAGVQAMANAFGPNRLPALHLALNAGGMSRDGLELSTPAGRRDLARIIELAGARIVGLCTHFPSNAPADLAGSIERFQRDQEWVFANSALRRDQVCVHAGSTLTLASGLDPKTQMMRCGAILYGIAGPRPDFQSTLALKSRVISLGTYPEGSTIGYERTVRLRRESRLASISVGYANGFFRRLSGCGQVLIGGEKRSVLGQVSMNTIVADVTGLRGIVIGDEVVVYGEQGTQCIGTRTIEAMTGTIMADLFSDWGQRNPRVACGG